MPASRSAQVEPSITARVLDTLKTFDDFASLDDLSILLEMHPNKMRAALWWLQKIHAVEAVDVGGKPFWFATPEYDMRIRTIDEHRKEDEPRVARKPRKSRGKVVAAPDVDID